MEVQLTEEQALMLETARRIGAAYGLDYWRGLDERGDYPSEMWRAICDAGFGGIALPEEYGGAGLGMLDHGAGDRGALRDPARARPSPRSSW